MPSTPFPGLWGGLYDYYTSYAGLENGIKLTACVFTSRSRAAMSESGGVPHHSRDALSGSSYDPGTDARRRGRTPTRNSGGKGSSRHSSRRSSGRHEGARLRGQEDSAGVAAPALDLDPRRNSPAPTPGRQAGPEPWALVLDALAELRGKVEALEADRQRRPPSPGPVQAPAHMDDVSVGDVPPGDPEPLPPGSPATFSGFSTGMVEDEAMSVSGNPAESTLIQGTKTFGPSDNVGADIDPRVAEGVEGSWRVCNLLPNSSFVASFQPKFRFAGLTDQRD